MRFRNRLTQTHNRRPALVKAAIYAIIIIMISSGASALVSGHNFRLNSSLPNSPALPVQGNAGHPITSSYSGSRVAVATPSNTLSKSGIKTYGGNVSVMVTFKLSNQTELSSFLSNLSNPNSFQYHRYITRNQFQKDYGTNGRIYNDAKGYFSSFSGVSVQTYADHVSIQVKGPAKEISRAFNTSLMSNGDSRYSAASQPSLPAPIGTDVSIVTGLTNAPVNINLNLGGAMSHKIPSRTVFNGNGYPAPSGSNPQEIYGSDMQVAYDEQTLLNTTYPTNEVIATLLWSGQNQNGTNVGPFNPSDVYAYFNATLPSYEPHPIIHGVPVNGAPQPGVSSEKDITGANLENTLDLEMVGSTAPGANIYNVYGPNGTTESTNAALAYILNPNSTYSALNNVSVITNSWGTGDNNNTAWYTYLQEAQARGITVLASSGDSGDNTHSSKYTGGPGNVEFPSSMAYNNFGVTAVGGTTVSLSQSDSLMSQVAWYISANDTLDGGPAGSTGGISTVYREPSWQLNSLANNLIKGAGRATPDISALANNTIIYISINGTLFESFVWGTSIASPLEAGIVAEINAVLNHYNESNLGYLNPLLYNLGNQQFTGFKPAGNIGYIAFGSYNSTLPMLPFFNVSAGRNHLYASMYGYDFVTGWGPIDAYNFTNYVLQRNFDNKANALQGVRNNLSLNGLKVTSYYENSTGAPTSTVNTGFNASIQQNFFLADQMGAPIYWIQNVIYINGSQSQGWQVNYSGWVIFPFYGQYPSLTVYEFNYPLGKIISMPHVFNVTSWLSGSGLSEMMNFQVNSHLLQLPVPGAAYIISGQNYTYSWQGHSYYNGPYPDNNYPGGLTPQFGLVGGPSLGFGEFASPTGGSMHAYVEQYGTTVFKPSVTSTYSYNADQTGEESHNLAWNQVSGSNWTLGISNGSTTQGVLSYSPSTYQTVFSTDTLPAGATWYANVSDGLHLSSTTPNITALLPDGNYTVNFSSSGNYSAAPSQYIIRVAGSSSSYAVQFYNNSNNSYIAPYDSIDNYNHLLYAGFTYNLTEIGQLSGVKDLNTPGIDTQNNYAFVSNINNGSIQIYNLTSGRYVGHFEIKGSFTYFTNIHFDNTTGFIYAIANFSQVIAINPVTLQEAYKVSLPGNSFTSNFTSSIRTFNHGNEIAVLSGDGNLTTFNASNGKLLDNLRVAGAGNLSLINDLVVYPDFVVVGHIAYVSNMQNNLISAVNLETLSIMNISLPANYNLTVLVPYGSSGNLFIGSTTLSDRILNTSSNTLSTGPTIKGDLNSGVKDPYDSTVYLSVLNLSSVLMGRNDYFGNITAIDSSNNAVLASTTGNAYSIALVFNPVNQRLYESSIASDIVVSYSVYKEFKVTFDSSNLSSSVGWYVNITGQPASGITSGIISGSSYSFYLPAGHYLYRIGTTDYKWSSPYGTFNVINASLTVKVHFTRLPHVYYIFFKESGLPSGATWKIDFGGSYVGNGSIPNEVIVEQFNGSYSYSVPNLTTDYASSNGQGTVTVDGSNVTVNVGFSLFAHLLGNINPSGSAIKVNGKSYSTNNGGYNISLEAGSYEVVVSDSGYSTFYRNVTLTSGQNLQLNINLTKTASTTPPSKTPSTPSQPLNSKYVYAAAIGGVIVVAAGMAVALRRRK